MARLYKRKNLDDYYVKHAFRKGDFTAWTTYQISPEVVTFLSKQGIGDGDQIPQDLFYVLLENDLIYTDKNGAGVEAGGILSGPTKRALDILEKASESCDGEEEDESLESDVSEDFYDESDIVEVDGFFRGRIPSEPIVIPTLKPIATCQKFTIPFEFFPSKAIHSCLIYDSLDHDYKLLKSYWRFFELSGLASYTSDSEYNDVIGRFLELSRVTRSFSDTAYGDTFDTDYEMAETLLNMPIIREDLLHRFPECLEKDENHIDCTNVDSKARDSCLAYAICESVYRSVQDGITYYYKDRLGSNFIDLWNAMIVDLREHLTVGNDVYAHFRNNKYFKETGFTSDEERAMSNYIAAFNWDL